MQHELYCKWSHDLVFEGHLQGKTILIDGTGGEGDMVVGPSPKRLLLLSVAGCTAMDVISILKKARVHVDDFTVRIVGDVSEEHPKVYTHIKLVYEFHGENLEASREKILNAINLSQDKYCGVSAMVSKAAPIVWELKLREN
jgi:putative redox protein